MRIDDELSKPINIDAGRMAWIASPAAGTDRRRLYRAGAEGALQQANILPMPA